MRTASDFYWRPDAEVADVSHYILIKQALLLNVTVSPGVITD